MKTRRQIAKHGSLAELIIFKNPENRTTQRIPFHKNLPVIENRRFLFRTHSLTRSFVRIKSVRIQWLVVSLIQSFSLTHFLCLSVNSMASNSLCFRFCVFFSVGDSAHKPRRHQVRNLLRRGSQNLRGFFLPLISIILSFFFLF